MKYAITIFMGLFIQSCYIKYDNFNYNADNISFSEFSLCEVLGLVSKNC